MRRREFMMFVGGAGAAWPHAMHAQEAVRIYRVGVMIPLAENRIARHSVVHAVLSTSSIADAPSVRASVSGRDGGRLEA
jgi:hypothetical protein